MNYFDYFVALFGSFVFNFFLFSKAKNEYDNKNEPFDYKKFAQYKWDDWVLTTLFAPILVWYLDDIVFLINSTFSLSIPVLEVYYLGAGVLVELVIFGIMKLSGWKESIFPKSEK